MSGPKRNPDALNTIGVVVVGICGAVLVYVSIVALQAFYMNDTSEVQTMADYGGQDTAHQSLRATQTSVIDDCGPNTKPEAGKQQTYRIPIKYAIKLVADGAKVDPANLIPSQGRSDKPTILPIFGRPKVTPKADGAKPDDAKPAGTGDVPLTPTGGQGMGGGQPPGQGPTPGTGAGGPPTGTGAADPNPTGAQTPSRGGQMQGGTGADSSRVPASTPLDIKPGSAAAPGGNPPTPNPKPAAKPAAGSAAKPAAGSTAKPAAGSAAKPAAGSAAKPAAGSAAKGSAK